jgi:hypothetical protein
LPAERRRGVTKGVLVLGSVVAIVGAVVLYFSASGFHSLIDQASQTPTGRYTRETMTDIIIVIIELRGGSTALVVRP